MQHGDVGRFVIPRRCRLFHIAPHPWDHISSLHPQSPNRFIYRPRLYIHTPISTHARMLPLTHALMQMQARTINTPFLKIKRVNKHKTLFYRVSPRMFNNNSSLFAFVFSSTGHYDHNCSRIFLIGSSVTCKETKICHQITVHLGSIAIILNITRMRFK